MATQAQIEANRANAAKSTGPRTDEGKAVVAQNAVRHGLLAEQVVIKGEDPGEFEFYREALIRELAPVGDYENILAERAAALAWRLRRAERLQAEAFGTLLTREAWQKKFKKLTETSQLPKWMQAVMKVPDQGETLQGEAMVRDYTNYHVLERMGLYEQRIERSMFKVMGELERLRVMREVDANHRQAPLDAATQTLKSDARSTKSETNSNDQNANDRKEVAPARDCVEAEGPGDGTQDGAVAGVEGEADSAKQSQSAAEVSAVNAGFGGRRGTL